MIGEATLFVLVTTLFNMLLHRKAVLLEDDLLKLLFTATRAADGSNDRFYSAHLPQYLRKLPLREPKAKSMQAVVSI